MKNFILQFALTFFFSWIVQLLLPWWSLVIVAAGVAVFFHYKYAAVSFLAGFLAIGLLWMGYTYWISTGDSTLTARMAELLGGVSPFLLVILSTIIGAIAGGLGALTGAMGRQLLGLKKTVTA